MFKLSSNDCHCIRKAIQFDYHSCYNCKFFYYTYPKVHDINPKEPIKMPNLDPERHPDLSEGPGGEEIIHNEPVEYTRDLTTPTPVCRKKPLVIRTHGLLAFKKWTGTEKRLQKGSWKGAFEENECSYFVAVEDLQNQEIEEKNVVKNKEDFKERLKELLEKKKQKEIQKLIEEEEINEPNFESLESLQQKEYEETASIFSKPIKIGK